MPVIDRVERIAVLRANGIGDFMFALPALESLAAAYPQAEITLLAAPWHRRLLGDRPGPIDEVVVVPIWPGVREEEGATEDSEEREEFFAGMKARGFDLALQMHGGGGNSNPFVARLGARVTAGSRAPGAPPLDLNLPYVYYQSEVMRLLEVVSLVGGRGAGIEPRLAVTAADLEESLTVLPRDERPLAALNPGASDPRRRWPPSKFAEVGDALARSGARVVIVGGPGDRELGRQLHGAMREGAEDLSGRFSLAGLTGLLSRCRLLVSNDTGPLHLAAAVGTATVGIYWCGNLINSGPPFRSRHRPLLSWRLECPVCGVDCTQGECQHSDSFVAEVPVADVVEVALELFDQELRAAGSEREGVRLAS